MTAPKAGRDASRLSMSPMPAHRLLIVDDDVQLREMLVRYFTAEGFEVDEASDGESALIRFEKARHDLVVLDVSMPGIDGFEVLRSLRSKSDAWVIMLTAKAEEVDRVIGLSMGADDYVTKPFSPRELTARVKAVLRRGRAPTPDSALRFEGLTIDETAREIRCDGRRVELSALEFDLLVALASSPGRVFTRSHLLERVWGWDYFGSDRLVDVHIASIRREIGDDATHPRFIATVRGVGYKFVASPT